MKPQPHLRTLNVDFQEKCGEYAVFLALISRITQRPVGRWSKLAFPNSLCFSEDAFEHRKFQDVYADKYMNILLYFLTSERNR